MASIDNALTTLARAKSYLDITGSTKDLILTMVILAASKYIEETYCKRKFKRQAYSQELYDGNGSPRLFLKNRHVISGQTFTLEVRRGIESNDEWETLDAEEYYIDYETGRISLVSGVFQRGVQNYRVSYTAGFYLPSATEYQDGTADDDDLPYDLELAMLDMVNTMYGSRTIGDIAKEKVGQVEVWYQSAENAAMAKHIKGTLDKYRRLSYA